MPPCDCPASDHVQRLQKLIDEQNEEYIQLLRESGDKGTHARECELRFCEKSLELHGCQKDLRACEEKERITSRENETLKAQLAESQARNAELQKSYEMCEEKEPITSRENEALEAQLAESETLNGGLRKSYEIRGRLVQSLEEQLGWVEERWRECKASKEKYMEELLAMAYERADEDAGAKGGIDTDAEDKNMYAFGGEFYCLQLWLIAS